MNKCVEPTMNNQRCPSRIVPRRIWPILMIHLVSVPCWAGPTIGESLVLGAEALGQEHLDQAIEQFGQAIETGSDRREQMAAAYEGRCAARYKKSLIDADTDLTREALEDCTRALVSQSDHQRAWRLRGTVHLTLGDPERALEDLNVALALAPEDHLTLQNRGLALARLGRTEKAVADFDRAIKLKPGHSWSFYNRGRLHLAQGLHEKAIDDFSSFIRFRRDYEPAYLHRGRGYLAIGAYQQSLVDLYESLRLKPEGNGEALFLRGISLYLLERYDEAIADFEEVRRLDDSDATNALWMYLARERLGKPGRDAFAGIRDLKEDRQWPGVMVSFMMGRGEVDAVLTAASVHAPPHGQPGETENLALFFLGELERIKQKPDQGKVWFSRLLEKKPGAPWVHAALWITRETRPETVHVATHPPSTSAVTPPFIIDPEGSNHPPGRAVEERELPPPADSQAFVGQTPTVRPGAPLTSGTPMRSRMTAQVPGNSDDNGSEWMSREPMPPVRGSLESMGQSSSGIVAPSQPTLPVRPETQGKPRRSPHVPGTYAFKLAAYENSELADQALAELSRMGLPVYLQDFMVQNHTYLRIWVGPFKTETQAKVAWKKVSAIPGKTPSAVRKR
ncbi:MAG: tetratricopeptide repeat protein [Magnetococcales bacterium]|nr:tetratricopeptide repeat protein [Magnetococcales bacterium]